LYAKKNGKFGRELNFWSKASQKPCRESWRKKEIKRLVRKSERVKNWFAMHFFSREAFHLALAAIRAKISSIQGRWKKGGEKRGAGKKWGAVWLLLPHMWKLCAFCSFLIDQQIYLIR